MFDIGRWWRLPGGRKRGREGKGKKERRKKGAEGERHLFFISV
jgi:hypothetical protein